MSKSTPSPDPYRFVIREPEPWFGTAEDQGLHLVLVEPEIPGNTGNVGRLCAGANIWLHLIKPLGFELDNKQLRRAGLDYWPNVKLCVHETLEAFEALFPAEKLRFFTTKTKNVYADHRWEPGSVLVFGKETEGLSEEVRRRHESRLVTIPIGPGVRSLNLSNACALAVYEALRQLDWGPLSPPGEE